jgi:hypothetical protein
MIDVDDRLRSELEELVPRDLRRNWAEVVTRSGLARERRRRRLAVSVGALVAAALLVAATPLGAGLAGGLEDFSSWLTGEPGARASEQEQREFDESQARSWLRFPQGTELRHLATAKTEDGTVDLLGFRSGSSALCLRVRVTGSAEGSTMSCAPLAELRRAGGPARVVIVDHGFGKGDKQAWYGVDRFNSSKLQITAGITTDAVGSVVVEDDAGRHEVPASANAFLYVAANPEVGQRVSRIWARTDDGLVAVPFAPAMSAFSVGSSKPAPPAPEIERRINGGRIGWLDSREERGESLEVLPARTRLLGRRENEVLFGRVLTPDPDRPMRIVLTLNANRPGGPAAGLCVATVMRSGGAGGGCTPYPEIFDEKPISNGMMAASGSSGFFTVSGVASDDVDRIEALLADGQRADVNLRDNTYLVDLPRANLPALLVSYDEEGRVIGVSQPVQDFGRETAAPARGRATTLIRVSGPDGVNGELSVGPSTDGGECMFTREYVDEQHTGMGVSCRGPIWTGPPLQVSSSFPPHFVEGRVRADVKTVRIRFADGSATDVTPTRGYVLWAAPAANLKAAQRATEAIGLRADGSEVARQSLFQPESPTRKRRSPSRG